MSRTPARPTTLFRRSSRKTPARTMQLAPHPARLLRARGSKLDPPVLVSERHAPDPGRSRLPRDPRLGLRRGEKPPDPDPPRATAQDTIAPVVTGRPRFAWSCCRERSIETLILGERSLRTQRGLQAVDRCAHQGRGRTDGAHDDDRQQRQHHHSEHPAENLEGEPQGDEREPGLDRLTPQRLAVRIVVFREHSDRRAPYPPPRPSRKQR